MNWRAFTAQMVPGWMSDTELALLARLAVGKEVLEVGTWKGRSAIGMALAGARRVWCVDTFQGDTMTGPQSAFAEFELYCRAAGVTDRVRAVVGDWRLVLPGLPLEEIGFAFFDALHVYQDTYDWGVEVAKLVAPGVPLGFHDYGVWPEVRPAVDDLCARTRRTITAAADSIRVISCLPSFA